jgi:hypothetical protein
MPIADRNVVFVGLMRKFNISHDLCPCLFADKIEKKSGNCKTAKNVTRWYQKTKIATLFV